VKVYVALLEKEPDSDYGVYFPDFPGCVTAGETMEEAVGRAPEALKLHLDGMATDGETIPEPSGLDAIMADTENLGTTPFLVSVPTPRGKVVRVNLTFEEPLLEDIDAFAKAHGKTRSGFLADAARAAMRSA
jgi:predicted RNase H-like HicB family nuclease